MAETYSAGIVTAYGAAVRGGYTGTYEQWCQDMAQLGDNVSEVREKTSQVEQTAQEFTQTIIPAAIQSVENEGTAQVGAVEAAGAAQVQAVETAGTTQTGNVNTAGAAQVQAVNDEGVLKVGAVEAAGAAQVQAVEDAGTDAEADIDAAKAAAITDLQAESTTQQAAIQQKGEDTRASIPDDYTALSDEVVELKNAIIREVQLSSSQKSWTRQSDGSAWTNLYFEQQFVEGKEYKVEIDFISADSVGFYCGTSVAESTSGGFVDGGNLERTQWKIGQAQDTGYKHTIVFTASGNANYFRFRCASTVYDFEQTFKVTVYEVSNSIDTLMTDVNGLKPEYDATVISGVNTAIGLNSLKKYFNLFFMTDTHADVWDATGAFKAANVVNKTQIADAFVHGGDFIANAYSDVGAYNDAVSKIRIDEFVNPKIAVVKGNHENYATTEKNSQFVLMFQNIANAVVDSADPDGGYFYIDYPKTKTRTIVLNTWYDATGSDEALGSYQLTWLYQTALKNLDAGYTVLVFAHNIVHENSPIDTNVLLPLRNLLSAFANKTTVGDYVFSSSDNGELAGVIVGHAHSDSYTNTSGFNKIVVTRAGSVNDDGYAVDIFTIDTDNHILYETRIGRGNSRAYTYGTTNSQIST